MDYIINPVWFYLFQFIAGIRVLAIVASILIGIAAIVIFIYVCVLSAELGECYHNTDRISRLTTLRASWLKHLKKVIVWFCIIVIISIAIPTQETILRMMIAHFATEDNVSMVFNKIIEGAQYILDKIAPVAETVGG